MKHPLASMTSAPPVTNHSIDLAHHILHYFYSVSTCPPTLPLSPRVAASYNNAPYHISYHPPAPLNTVQYLPAHRKLINQNLSI